MFLDPSDNTQVALTPKATDILYELAREMDLVVTEEEARMLSEAMDSLGEFGGINIVRLNKTSKLNSYVTRTAIMIAQQKRDPLYAKFAKAAQLHRHYRNMIATKYQSSAMVTAKKLLANAGKRNMVDVSSPKSIGNPSSV